MRNAIPEWQSVSDVMLMAVLPTCVEPAVFHLTYESYI